jgi:hypothetical protein
MLDVLVSIDYSRPSKVRRSRHRLQRKFRKLMFFLFEIPVSETIVVRLPPAHNLEPMNDLGGGIHRTVALLLGVAIIARLLMRKPV